MSLPDVLSELAALLPERVRFPSGNGFSCFVAGAWKLTSLYGPARTPDWQGQATLEAVLREECEARGWEWQGECVLFPRRLFFARIGVDRFSYTDSGDTPAEALALAVLQALKAEEREG